MRKLLHERLREFSDGTWKCPIKNFFIEDDSYTSFIELTKNDARILTDEIERYYIPRPRFEDGEPIQFGDEYVSDIGREGVLTWMAYRRDGSIVLGKKGKSANIGCDKFVKRPQPKVYDTDGVEIKVGDTVYPLNGAYGDNPLEVIGVIDSDYVRLATTDAEGWTSYLGKRVSHKEPDSLERIAESMIRYRNQAIADDMPEYDAITKWADRLTAIMERDAL